MNSLTVKALVSFVKRLVIFGLSIFLPAWSLDFWEAWVFLIIFFIPELLVIIYLLKKDKYLLERRLKGGFFAEKRIRQKVIMSLVSLSFILMILVSGFDHRFNWSHVPVFIVTAADAIVLLGFLIVFRVFKENSFASAVVEIAAKQKVISTGAYAMVRHPMYSGSLLINFSIPIALGSWWGLSFFLPNLVLLILRLLDEEKVLLQSLQGYEEYCRQVRYRLIPNIW